MLRKCVLRSDTVKAASLPLASFITSAVTRATMSLISLSLAMLLLPEVELYARDYATPPRRNRAGGWRHRGGCAPRFGGTITMASIPEPHSVAIVQSARRVPRAKGKNTSNAAQAWAGTGQSQ